MQWHPLLSVFDPFLGMFKRLEMKIQLIVVLIGALAVTGCGIKDDPLPVEQSNT